MVRVTMRVPKGKRQACLRDNDKMRIKNKIPIKIEL